MDGQEIIDHFDFLTDSSVDADRALVLGNQAYDRLMMKRAWNFLLDTEQTQTLVAGTRAYSHPSTQIFPVAIRFYNSTTGKYSKDYKPVPYKARRKYEDIAGYYYVDYKNSNIVLTSDPSTEWVGSVIEQDFTYLPDQLTLSTSPVFIRSFHPLIAFEMARFFWYNEQDEKDRAYDREFMAEYRLMLSEMETWDDRLGFAADPDIQPEENWTGGL